jgi:hypothetical protein
MKNTGRTYESLVEQVFVQLMEQDSVNNISVEKNKILQGKTTTHEIDVYWEFVLGGIKYSTIIQAKDWESKVPQGEMLKLKAILDDLPGQPRGIFVTKTGYQSGAMDVARANGIITYELREPTEEDWEGRIKTIVLNIKAYIPDSKVQVVNDDAWLQSELRRLDIKEIELSVSGMENEIFIENEDGTNWKSIKDIKDEEQEKVGMAEVHGIEVNIPMDVPRYIKTGNPSFPRIKLKEIKVHISNGVIESTTEIDGTKMVGFMLKNLIDNSEIVLDKNAKIRKDRA